MTDEEIWKYVNGTNRYMVSNFGNVKSLCGINEKILVPKLSKKTGYLSIGLMIDGIRHWYSIHRLVISTFNPIDNMDNYEVNHIDENKTNNHLSNLSWVTSKENCNYGNRNNKISKIQSKPVMCIETGIVYKNGREAALAYEIDKSSISMCCTGYRNRKTAGGVHWRYIDG